MEGTSFSTVAKHNAPAGGVYLAEEPRPSAWASLGWMGPPTEGGRQTVTSAILSTVGPATEMYSPLPSPSPSW
eukprot:3114043-Pyramimonas_sp.AAC.1